MIKIIFFSITLLLITNNCGFRVVKQSAIVNFYIAEITTEGEKRINYGLKNKLSFTSTTNDKQLIKINLDTRKFKNIKEKSIKNEITKYELNIVVKVEVTKLDNLKRKEFVVEKSGDYSVENQYSQTLNSEKKLTELLIDNLAKQILYQIRNGINDL